MAGKKEFRWFSIMDYEKEQDYLRRMHQQGWQFQKVTGLGVYRFEACAPEDVIYQLDYNKEGLAHKAEYVQMFADCGWEYIQDYAGYSYFRKSASAPGSDAIFCDEESRLGMMERVFKGRLLPLLILFCACLLPQFVIQMTSTHNYLPAAFLGGIIGIYLAVFCAFGIKYHQYKKGIKK